QELRQEIISKLLSIKDRPEGWLPHVVYVQDEDCDSADPEAKLYTLYKLLDFQDSGECQLLDIETNKTEAGALCEIETEGLITILNWYGELTGNHIYADEPKRLLTFVYPIKMNRNITDKTLIKYWNEGKIVAYTPGEFAALLNDEMFDEVNNYIRFINI
ncbi:MAG: hypothetical protein SNH27_15550, partial [Rikenellaceae bacterium]